MQVAAAVGAPGRCHMYSRQGFIVHLASDRHAFWTLKFLVSIRGFSGDTS